MLPGRGARAEISIVPTKLTFEGLLRLALNEEPPPVLADKLHRLLNEPFISNEAASFRAGPVKPGDSGLVLCCAWPNGTLRAVYTSLRLRGVSRRKRGFEPLSDSRRQDYSFADDPTALNVRILARIMKNGPSTRARISASPMEACLTSEAVRAGPRARRAHSGQE